MRIFTKLINNSRYIYQIHTRDISTSLCMNTVSKDIVESLERLALVDFSTDAAVKRLEQSIRLADKLMEVDTLGVEPLLSTIYDRNENLREDENSDTSFRKELMKVAPVSEEFYYVAPLGTYTKKQNEPNS